jgi:hypothetical protein
MSTLGAAGVRTSNRTSRSVSLPNLRSTKVAVPLIVVLGLVGIQLVQLLIGVFISQGAYELAQLKAYKHELGTTSEILKAEVDSLSSQQNLANAAQGLGMVANSNPVFLNVGDQQIIGKPTAAKANDTAKVARNLVPNSALVSTTDLGAIKAAQAAAKAAAKVAAATKVESVKTQTVKDVANSQTTASKVAFSGEGLLASPTN